MISKAQARRTATLTSRASPTTAQFVEHYYTTFDADRKNLGALYVRAHAPILLIVEAGKG